jgi:hypothetical protein
MLYDPHYEIIWSLHDYAYRPIQMRRLNSKTCTNFPGSNLQHPAGMKTSSRTPTRPCKDPSGPVAPCLSNFLPIYAPVNCS